MADERLRSRERAAAHDPAAGAALLVERLRAGTLSRERLELAAYCGDAGARSVLGPGHAFPMFLDSDPERGGRSFKSAEHVDTHPFVGWLRTLARWGGHVEVRAALAACRAALDATACCGCGSGVAGHPETHDVGLDGQAAAVQTILDHVESWLADPTFERADEIDSWCQEDEFGNAIGLAQGMPDWAFSLAAGVARVAGVDRATVRSHPLHAVRLAVSAVDYARGIPSPSKSDPEGDVRRAVAAALVAWALGDEPDPCTRVGPPLVTCTVCGRTKAPLGRSAPLEMSTCEPVECPGYLQDPRPSQLWPGERCEPPLCQHRRRP